MDCCYVAILLLGDGGSGLLGCSCVFGFLFDRAGRCIAVATPGGISLAHGAIRRADTGGGGRAHRGAMLVMSVGR